MLEQNLAILVRRRIDERDRVEDLHAVAKLAREIRELAEWKLGGEIVVDNLCRRPQPEDGYSDDAL